MRRSGRSAGVAATIAAAIALALPGLAFATTWSDPTTVWSAASSSESIEATGLVALDATTVVAAYSQRLSTGTNNVYVTRSTNGGTNWQPAAQVSESGGDGQMYGLGGVAGYGSDVDVAWWQPEPGLFASIHYAHSGDGGATFSDPVRLAKPDDVFVPVVGRGPNGVVLVAWESQRLSSVFVRVSHDGGQTFGPRQELWKTNEVHGLWRHLAVAIASDAIYVASSSPDRIELRRSLDGSHWGRRTPLAWYPSDFSNGVRTSPMSLAVEGANVMLGFVHETKQGMFVPSYRYSSDRGATWSARGKLANAYDQFTYGLAPVISLHDGIGRAVFAYSEVDYRETTDGTTWSPAEKVSGDALYATPVGVGYTDRIVVAYGRQNYLEVRTGTP